MSAVEAQSNMTEARRNPAKRRLAPLTALMAGALALGGCAVLDSLGGSETDDSNKKIAPKDRRISIMELEEKIEPDPRIADLEVTVPVATINTSWDQPGGSAQNGFYNLQVGDGIVADRPDLDVLWKIEAGRGASDDTPLTAPPIIADEKIFVLDSHSHVRAFERKGGKEIWEVDLVPEGESARVGFGGGVAYGDGKIYVATGFGEITALNAQTGEEVWQKSVRVPVRSAPTYANGRVFVIATDNQLHTLDAQTGLSVWNHRAMAEASGILSAVSPAVIDNLVIAPFSSGELYALRTSNGRETWSDSLVKTGKAQAMAGINDIAARPVVDEGRVYAVSHSGRMVCIDIRTGERVWTANVSGVQTPWVSGDFVYLVTVQGELIAVTKADGRVRWLTKLKRYEDMEDKEDPIAWLGPLMVNSRLMMMNSLGEIAFFDPKDGKVLRAFKGPAKTFIQPVVANGVVYILSDDGELIAMR